VGTLTSGFLLAAYTSDQYWLYYYRQLSCMFFSRCSYRYYFERVPTPHDPLPPLGSRALPHSTVSSPEDQDLDYIPFPRRATTAPITPSNATLL
jgi:hypothetical protein